MARVHTKAEDIAQLLEQRPTATVAEIAESVELGEHEVIAILDSHHVGDDGRIRNGGNGAGGGWRPARLAEEKLFEQLAAMQQIEEQRADDAAAAGAAAAEEERQETEARFLSAQEAEAQARAAAQAEQE